MTHCYCARGISNVSYPIMQRVLLINPEQIYYKKTYRSSGQGMVGLPLGLLYVAGVLENKGCLVKIVDSMLPGESKKTRSSAWVRYGLSSESLQNCIKEFKPDIVGISSQFSSQEDGVFRTAALIKNLSGSISVLVGGANVGCRVNTFMADKNIDIAVKNEAENTVGELADYYRGEKRLEEIKGIAYRKGVQIYESVNNNFISELDSLPLPAYHLIDMEKYLTLYKNGVYVRDRDVKRNISMITSRGCPHGCIFCSVSLGMGKSWRAHSAPYIANHIKYVSKEYRVKHIHFEDDNLFFDIKRFLGFLETLSEEDISWDTPNGIRVDLSIDEKILLRMRASGCKSLTIAVESGDEHVLNNIIKKALDLREVEEFARRCKKTKVPLRAFFVLGFPGETKRSMQKTYDFSLLLARKYGVEIINLIATPLFGTELYKICREKKYLTEELTPKALSESTVSDGRCLIATEDFSAGDVEEISKRLTSAAYLTILLKRALLHPVQLFKRIGNFYTFVRTMRRILLQD